MADPVEEASKESFPASDAPAWTSGVEKDAKDERLAALPGWRIETSSGAPELVKSFPFPDFRKALDFAVRLAEEADREDHHPAILVEWGRATVRWGTHKTKRVEQKDFEMAAKTDAARGEIEMAATKNL